MLSKIKALDLPPEQVRSIDWWADFFWFLDTLVSIAACSYKIVTIGEKKLKLKQKSISTPNANSDVSLNDSGNREENKVVELNKEIKKASVTLARNLLDLPVIT